MSDIRVTAIVVTRGDVDLQPILESLPANWEKLVWTNGQGVSSWTPEGVWRYGQERQHVVQVGSGGMVRLDQGTLDLGLERSVFPDRSVYGRYAAIDYAGGDLIYVQDDDVMVSDPIELVTQWLIPSWGRQDHVVCNMPQEFRHDFYKDHALVGFGGVFRRDAPARAFKRYWDAYYLDETIVPSEADRWALDRTCDVVFTALSPRVLVDVPKMNLAWATDESRMYRQPEHVAERARALELALQVRDA